MMRTQKITISGKEFELYYSTKAMLDVEKRCGDTSKLKEWLGGASTAGESFKRISGVLTDLINGAVYKHNADISLGLCSGEKQTFFTDEQIIVLLSPAELIKYKDAIYGAINAGLDYEIPEGITEPDPDLADVESEKNV